MKYKNPGDMYNAFKKKVSIKNVAKKFADSNVGKNVTKKLLSIPKGKAKEEMVKIQVKK